MNFTTPEPAISPTPEEQRDALQKGLGRAMLWARDGKLSLESLKDAVREDLRYDRHCEPARGDWLWKLMTEMNCQEGLKDFVFDLLTAAPAEYFSSQLFQLGYHYASSGDSKFRDLLYEKVQSADGDCYGEKDLIRLDGEAGLLFLLGRYSKSLNEEASAAYVEYILDCAMEMLGEGRVNEALARNTELSIQKLIQHYELEKESPKSYVAPERATVAEVIDESRKEKPLRSISLTWGIRASAEELQEVLPALFETTRAESLVFLLNLFRHQPLDVFDSRLLEYCRHEDINVRQMGCRAVSRNSHLSIRQLAISMLTSGGDLENAAELLIHNYQPGDEIRLLEAFDPASEADDRHAILVAIRNVLEENPEADASRLGLVIYASTSCAVCRSGAAEILKQRQVVPEWLISEIRYDSYEACRTVFEEDQNQIAA